MELIKDRVRLEIKGELAYVSLARADKRNGLDLVMMEALVEAARRIKKDRALRAVILQGEGPAFCAGLDFASVTKTPVKMFRAFTKYGIKKTNLYQEMCWCWRELPIPVLAVVQGQCFGGGLQLALAADFRFATPDSDWSVMEAKWGLIPDMTAMLTLREVVRMDVARELTYTGRIIKGDEAHTLGLVSHLAADPLAAALALAEEIITRSPDSVSAAKSLLNQSWHADENTTLNLESSFQFKLLRSKNQRRAMKANFAKQRAEFLPRQADY